MTTFLVLVLDGLWTAFLLLAWLLVRMDINSRQRRADEHRDAVVNALSSRAPGEAK